MQSQNLGDSTRCNSTRALANMEAHTLAQPLAMNCAPQLVVDDVEVRSGKLWNRSVLRKLLAALVKEAWPNHPDAVGLVIVVVDVWPIALSRWPVLPGATALFGREKANLCLKVWSSIADDVRTPPNDPATRPARAFDCNLDEMAGFAAAHG